MDHVFEVTEQSDSNLILSVTNTKEMCLSNKKMSCRSHCQSHWRSIIEKMGKHPVSNTLYQALTEYLLTSNLVSWFGHLTVRGRA